MSKVPQLSICTYNVHSLTDQYGQDGFDRVVKVLLLQKTQPDIVCLQVVVCKTKLFIFDSRLTIQEIHVFDLKKLKSALPYQNSIKWGGCAILTNLPMQEVEIAGRKARKGFYPRFLTARIFVHGKQVLVTCCHLNHKDERKRMAELRTMELQLAGLFSAKEPQIWTGDFNSLTEED